MQGQWNLPRDRRGLQEQSSVRVIDATGNVEREATTVSVAVVLLGPGPLIVDYLEDAGMWLTALVATALTQVRSRLIAQENSRSGEIHALTSAPQEVTGLRDYASGVDQAHHPPRTYCIQYGGPSRAPDYSRSPGSSTARSATCSSDCIRPWPLKTTNLRQPP